jgi:hypothetical protein
VLLESVAHHVAYAGLELLGSSDPPASASQVVGTVGVKLCIQFPWSFLPSSQPQKERLRDKAHGPY